MKNRLIKSALISLAVATAVTAVPLYLELSEMNKYGCTYDQWCSNAYNAKNSLDKCNGLDVDAREKCLILPRANIGIPAESQYSIWRFVWIFIYAYIISMLVVFSVLSLISKLSKKKV